MRRFTTWILTLACVAVVSDGARAEWRLGVGLQGGAITSSRLYRAAADDNITWRWTQPGGAEDLRGSEVLVETKGLFDGDLANVLQFGVRFTVLSADSPWGGVFSVAVSDLDVNAKVRSTQQNVDDVIWDQFFTTQIHAVGTYALAPEETRTPFLLGGLGWVQRSSEGATLDQGSLALIGGAGLRLGGTDGWVFDLEVRGVWSALDFDDEDARLEASIAAQNQVVQPDSPSDYRFEGEGAALAFEFNASWSYIF